MGFVEYSGSEIMIMTCSDCNAKCKHCYVGYSGSFDGDDLFALCKKLNEKYKVVLNGTEILLHPEFFKSIKLIGDECLLTNGLALKQNPYLVEELVKSGIKYVGISYHFGIHSEISNIDLSVVQYAVEILKKAGIITEIRTTIDVRNFDKVIYMCEKAHSIGADGIKFTNLMNTGRVLKWEQNQSLSDVQIQQFLNDLEMMRKLYPKNEFKIRRCGTFGPGEKGKFFCPAGKEQIVITPDLKVYPCIFLISEGMEIGYVDEGRVMVREFCNTGDKCIAKQILNDTKH